MNIKDKYLHTVPKEYQEAIKICTETAEEYEVNLFLIGGLVRDLILNKPFKDIDITVEGNAIEFLEYMAIKYSKLVTIMSIHDDFKTVKAVFKVGGHEVEIDFASTREEYYEYPAALPSLRKAGVPIKEDLIRRDFTINAIGMSLNMKNFGEIIDYLNGLEDLENSIVRITHPNSFIDDPTRIIRGLKYRVRLNFIYDKVTEYLQQEVISSAQFDNLCSERMKSELRQALNYNEEECFNKIISEKIYRLVSTKIDFKMLPSGKFVKEIVDAYSFMIPNDNVWLVYLCTLFSALNNSDFSDLIERMNLANYEKKVFLDFLFLRNNTKKIEAEKTKFGIYEILFPCTLESIIGFITINKNSEVHTKMFLYLTELRKVKISITGDDLINLGLEKGPIFKQILREILKAKINNKISEKEEKTLLINLYNELN